MTSALFSLLSRVRGPLMVQFVGLVLVLAFLPLAIIVDVVCWAVRTARFARVARMQAVQCPRGHEVELLACGWQCQACGFITDGNGFLPCPACERTPAYISCPCGASIQNPIYDEDQE